MVLGHVLRQTGRISEERAVLREALRIHPGNELLREHLIYALDSPPYSLEEARAEVDLLLRDAAGSAEAEAAAAAVAAHARAWETAREHAHRAEGLLDASAQPFRALMLGGTLILIPGVDKEDAALRVWQKAATYSRVSYLPRIFYALLLGKTDPAGCRRELKRARRGYWGSGARFDEQVREARSALAEAIAWRDQSDVDEPVPDAPEDGSP